MTRRRMSGLGQVAQLAQATGPIAFKYLATSVLAGMGAAVVGEMLGGPDTKDSWAERSVFNARMAAMQAGFLMVQCQVGGAQPNKGYGCDDLDQNCICPGGTSPTCSLPPGKLAEWRTLMRNFSAFYAEVGGSDWFNSDWLVLDPDSAEVTQARGYARSLVRFFVELPKICPNYQMPFNLADIVGAEQGTTAQQVAELALIATAPDSGWVKGLKYAAWGLGAVTVLWIGTTVYGAFKKGR